MIHRLIAKRERLIYRPNPGGIPIPRHPDAARITRAYKLRQQPVEPPAA
jgi:hypothetical protein